MTTAVIRHGADGPAAPLGPRPGWQGSAAFTTPVGATEATMIAQVVARARVALVAPGGARLDALTIALPVAAVVAAGCADDLSTGWAPRRRIVI